MQNAIAAKKERDLTEGPIFRQLLLFALPLMAGNLFQQLYNTVDSIVVGNFLGKEALAAVGSVGPVINSLIGFFMGLSTGAGVVISQYYGAKEKEKLSRTVQTMVLMTFGFCGIFTLVGIWFTPQMLRLMSTPADVFTEAADYLRIYFAGVSGLLIYNMGSGILRAVGDSRRPLYFLIFSAGLNTGLDLLLVIAFRMGIAGAAYATVFSQCLSAVLVLLVLTKTTGDYRIVWRGMRPDCGILGQIVGIGIPTAVQQTVTSLSNVFVQSYINFFGSDVMAGWSACMKIDMFMMLPMMSVGLAATTFVGQNFGAGNISRAKKGTWAAFGMSVAVTALLMIPLIIFAPWLVGLFNREPGVVDYGCRLMYLMSPFYLVCCVNQVFASALRGAGNTRAPMIVMLGSFVVFRQIYLFIASRTAGTLTVVALGYPAGWLVCSILILICYKRFRWERG